jgi:hypothetical protein
VGGAEALRHEHGLSTYDPPGFSSLTIETPGFMEKSKVVVNIIHNEVICVNACTYKAEPNCNGSSQTHCGAILNRQNFLSHLTKRHTFVVHKGDQKQVDLMFHDHGVKDGESPFTGRTGGEVASRPVQAVVTPAHIAYYDSGQKCSDCDYFRVEPDVKHDPDHNFTDSRWLQHARGSTGAIRYFEAKWGGLFRVTDVFEWDRVCWAWNALRSRLEWVRELEEWVTVSEEFTRRSNDMDHE